MNATTSFPPLLFPAGTQKHRLSSPFPPLQLQPSPSKFKPKPVLSNCSNIYETDPPAPSTACGSSNDVNDDGIPMDEVKILAKFNSRHNYIRVLQVSRRADHPLAGSRLLLLDYPGNIHSISFLFKLFTETYFDVFATLPPIIPPGPIAILGFGAGTAARIILNLYPEIKIQGWEVDPSVISLAREYFGLEKLEKQFPNQLFINIGDAFEAEINEGFAGILIDLFSKGSVVGELQNPKTWERLKKKLKRGGRIMVNCGGRCVEAEDGNRDGRRVMEETLKAMESGIADKVFVLMLGKWKGDEDSCLAISGQLPDDAEEVWRMALHTKLRKYVKMWRPYNG